MRRFPILPVAAIIAGLVGVACSIVSLNRAPECLREVARESFDGGVRIGRIVGMCETLQTVALANGDSAWAADPEVLEALETCGEVMAQFAPETTYAPPVPDMAGALDASPT